MELQLYKIEMEILHQTFSRIEADYSIAEQIAADGG